MPKVSPLTPETKVLRLYVTMASLLAHLALVPAWVLWLNQDAQDDAPLLSRDCQEAPPSEQLRPEIPGPVCQPSGDSLHLSLREIEVSTPPKPEELKDFVLTPPDHTPSDTPPPEDAFAATTDTHTEQQSIARGERLGLASAPGAPRATTPTPQPTRARAAIESPRADLGAPQDPEQAGDSPTDAVVALPPLLPQDDHPDTPQIPDFVAERANALAPGGSLDYVKDVPDGERTLLNRRRVSYADFFERVQLGVANHWDPASVYRRRDPQGKIYGVQDRLTILSITLHGDGSLAKLFVLQPSGLDFLDDEAVRAVRSAVPFPNPPEGLKDLDGLIHFRFAFAFEITTRRHRVFRYR